MNRRQLIAGLGALSVGACATTGRRSAGSRFDAVVVGDSLGGCAAALAATRAGHRVALVTQYPWIGGQLTSQLVPPDENRWIEEGGATASYRALRRWVRDWYRIHGDLTDAAGAHPRLNPGRGWVSRLCALPEVWHAGLVDLLAGPVAAGRLALIEGAPTAVDVEGDLVRAVTVVGPEGERTLEAPWFLDATELGDLLPLAEVEHVRGAEGRDETGEPHALERADPRAEQAFTWCLALEHRAGEDHVGEPPPGYARWRDRVPGLTPPWPGPLLSLSASHPITLEPRRYRFAPDGSPGEDPELFSYRRVVDPSQHQGDRHPVTLVNWPQNDYWEASLLDEPERARREARELSLALLHWLQTEVPRQDGGTGWPGLRACPEVAGSEDGLAQAPYVRESRRIRALTTVREQDLGGSVRDSIGIGHYRIDLHPTVSGHNYVDLDCPPFQVPLGALVPVRVENLLPACKNIGATHVTNGALRLHPVEWTIGEAAGELVAHCLARSETPRSVHARPAELAEYQRRLRARGFLLTW